MKAPSGHRKHRRKASLKDPLRSVSSPEHQLSRSGCQIYRIENQLSNSSLYRTVKVRGEQHSVQNGLCEDKETREDTVAGQSLYRQRIFRETESFK
jgi:hypothetical protein